MLKVKKSYRNETIFFVLMALVCFMIFCLGKKKVLAVTDGEVNLESWKLGEINNAGEATLTDYRIDDSLKSIVVPNAVDFIQSDSSRYGNLKKVYITSLIMNRAAYNGNKSGGSLKISDTGSDDNNFDEDKTKVFAEGEDWSYALSSCYYNGLYGIFDIETIDLSRFDTTNITDMKGMFRNIGNLKTLNLSNFNTENVKDMSEMFYSLYNIQALDVSSFDTSSVENMRYMFGSCNALTDLNLENFNTCNVTNMDTMFYSSRGLMNLNLSNFDTSQVTTMDGMFAGCISLSSIDLSEFDTSNVHDMSYMFSGCSSLTSLDLSNFDTSNVAYMSTMFRRCSSLTSLDLSNFDTSNVTDMASMFYGCSSLTSLDLSNFDTRKVTDMSYMFSGCRMLKNIIGVSDFDVSSAKYVEHMFDGCNFKNEINFRSWQPIKVLYMYGMYKDCFGHGDLYLDSFDAGNVDIKYGLVNGNKDYGTDGLFRNSHNILYIDLSGFNLENLNRNNPYDKIFAIDDEEGRQEPLLITTNDEFLTELTELRNNCQNRTLFTTTLKVDGKNIQFKSGDESEFVKYNGDKTEKYINLYESFTTTDSKEEILQNLATRLKEEKDNLNVASGIKLAGFLPEEDYEGKVSYSLQGNYVAVTWPTLKEKIYVGTSKILDNIPELPDGCKLLYKTEDSDWIEYTDGELIKFDKSGDYKIYVKIIDASGNFGLEYTDDNDKDYMDLTVLEKEKNDEEKNDQQEKENDRYGWSTMLEKEKNDEEKNDQQEKENDRYGWSTIENSGGSSGGGSSSSSTNQDLISRNESADTKTQTPTKSEIPEKLQTRKYLIGYDDEKIKPENYVTNAEFATVIYRLMNDGEEINYDKLKDLGVEKSDWFAEAVAYLIDDLRKIIQVTDEKFNPNKNITGYEMLNIIYNVLKFYGVESNSLYAQNLNSEITRAKMSEIIFKAFERKSKPGQKIYSDLNDQHWAYKYLMDASE